MIRWFRIYFIFLLLLLPTKPANVRYSGIWLKMDRQQKRDAWGNVSNLPSGDQGDRGVGNVWDMWYVKQLIRVIRKPTLTNKKTKTVTKTDKTSVNTNINRRIPKKSITDFDPSRMRVKVILSAKSGLIWRRLCAGWSDWRFRFLQAWRVGGHKRDHGIWFIYLQTDPWEWSFCSLRIVFIEWGSNYYNSLLIAWCYWNAIDVTC